MMQANSSSESTPRPSRMRYYLIALIALLMLAGIAARTQSAAANDQPNTTIPPTGTIPVELLVKLTVINAAPFNAATEAASAAAIATTAVDICTSDGTLIGGLNNVAYLEQRTVYLPSGRYHLKITKAGTGCSSLLLDLDEFDVGNGAIVYLILVGDLVTQPLDTIFLITNPGGPTLYLPTVWTDGGAQ